MTPAACAAIPPVSDAATHMLQQWLELSEVERRTFVALSRELTRSSDLVETSTLDLSERFQNLAVIAQGQVGRVDMIIGLAKSIEVDGEAMPLDDAMHRVEQVLSKVIDAILSVSKHAMRMVYALEEVARDVEGSEQCVVQIEAINAKTRYLALNAAIEASHAGGAGGAFGVIAREMKELSAETAQASRQVGIRISAVRASVREGHGVLREIATLDLSEHITAKEQIDSLIVGIMAQNNAFKAALADTAQSSGDLTHTIGQLITGMQFQDRTKQHISQVIDVLAVLQENALALQHATREALPGLARDGLVNGDWVERIVEKQTLGSVKRRMLTQLLADAEAGPETAPDAVEIELF
nr:methyl-accepting chemotaxis protein [uncultured Lichenicoccus sp.]